MCSPNCVKVLHSFITLCRNVIHAVECCYITVAAVEEPLLTWDNQIQELCGQVNSVIDMIGQTNPEWLNKITAEQVG